MSFGDNLRTLIDERRMTQKELAGKLNIAPSTLGSYVQNKREPDFITLKTIAQFFEVSIDYLLDNPCGHTDDPREAELLRIFRALTPEQSTICLEQCRVFIRMNDKDRFPETKTS